MRPLVQFLLVAFILVLQFGITFPCPSQQYVFLAYLSYELFNSSQVQKVNISSFKFK